jgi:hypothetical protein
MILIQGGGKVFNKNSFFGFNITERKIHVETPFKIDEVLEKKAS